MNKPSTLISLVLIGGLLIPMTSSAHSYRQTSGYQSLINWANQLRGVSFNDQRYRAYCNRYAQISVAQANQRISQQCKSAIPTPNKQLKDRWSKNTWGHKGWCLSVSAHASKAESARREGGLRNCLNRHSHQTPKALIRKNCLANDNMHKKAARGDIKFVQKCLNAGVNANIREGNQWTPLHSASRNGRIKIAKLLISRGAQVNAREITGRTPMDQAKVGRYITLQNYLKSRGGILTR